jgi:hypothetical protein
VQLHTPQNAALLRDLVKRRRKGIILARNLLGVFPSRNAFVRGLSFGKPLLMVFLSRADRPALSRMPLCVTFHRRNIQ